jgi:hypothetical protein
MVHPVWRTNRISRYILNSRMERFHEISHSAHLHSLRIGPVPNDRGWNGSTYTCEYRRGVTVYQSNQVTLFIKECSTSSTRTVFPTMSSQAIKTISVPDIQDVSTNVYNIPNSANNTPSHATSTDTTGETSRIFENFDSACDYIHCLYS